VLLRFILHLKKYKMALQLINNEGLQIAGSELIQENPVILCDSPQVTILSSGITRLVCPYMVFSRLTSFAADRSKNSLKTEKLYKKSITVDYNRLTDGDQYEFVDIKMKEDLVNNYGVNGDNIEFAPPHAE